ncbi:alpha/beta hydrolase [Rhodococcus fascians]|nr:alpha/beta hydrolase [Rhodococcus fascians]MBY3999961.1 alpha/beta hydrolase [Rhodococcus fascians]MBY4005144.1 alpha/beta hydrolase [Rhodococcus fascians]MBY4010297.1 alpha/beta hydrolase [Rhodococcus fascians]MBY4020340.1 alpha/beta hydrolase [Rhodococcus fascians]
MRTQLDRTIGSIAVHDYPTESAAAATVVMLPSLAQSRWSWVDVANRIDPAIRCLAIDMPGQGDSPYPPHFMSIFDFADSIRDVLVTEGIEHAVLVGNSLGAVVASQLAVAEKDLVASVVLVGAPAWADEVARRAWLRGRSELLVGPDGLPRPTTKEAVAAVFGAYDPERHRMMWEEAQKAGRALAWSLWALYGYDYASQLEFVDQPLLAVYGSNDWLEKQSIPTLKRAVSDLHIETVDGGGHLLPLDRPAELAALMSGWASSFHTARSSTHSTKE